MKEGPEERSRIMRAVKGSNTAPELTVRRVAHGMGYRFRLHRRDIPGKPDMVFPARRKIIFVHGCFWHGHDCARGNRIPKLHRDYWVTKITRNRERDQLAIEALAALGWNVAIFWECEIKKKDNVFSHLRRFLEGPTVQALNEERD
jgi:DNA mismatch endonuclease, patch repair protein